MTDLLRFVHISDTHIHPDYDYGVKEGEYHGARIGAEKLVQAVNALPFMPDFILHTGDIAHDPVPDDYDFIHALLSQLKAPVHYLIGNHDDSATVQTKLMGRETVSDYVYYEFEVNGVQFVCLDSNAPHTPDQPSGNVTQEQLDWLDSICTSNDDRPLVVAVHHNIIPVGVPWLDNWMRMENGELFHAAVRQARDRLCGVFYGHIHQNITTFRDGVLYSAVASSWRQFMSYPIPDNDRHSNDLSAMPGFNVVTITENRTHIRRHTFEI